MKAKFIRNQNSKKSLGVGYTPNLSKEIRLPLSVIDPQYVGRSFLIHSPPDLEKYPDPDPDELDPTGEETYIAISYTSSLSRNAEKELAYLIADLVNDYFEKQ